MIIILLSFLAAFYILIKNLILFKIYVHVIEKFKKYLRDMMNSRLFVSRDIYYKIIFVII